jgi:alpha-galactosidase
MKLGTAFLILAAALPCSAQLEVRLEQLDLSAVKTLAPPVGYPAKAAQSVAAKPLTMKGGVYAHGVGVLDVNQDPLGQQAARKSQEGLLEVGAKPLEDGTLAVGLFNRGIETAKVTAKWSDPGLSGRQPVRDLWQRKNLGDFDNAFRATVSPYGMVMIKVGKVSK